MGKVAALFGSKLVPRGVLTPTLMLDLWGASVRQADPANHNPPAASSAAIVRDRCFAFILFCFDSSFTFTFATHRAGISGSWLSIWNEGGEFWCEGPASRNELDTQRDGNLRL
jgi:hypothetical protein